MKKLLVGILEDGVEFLPHPLHPPPTHTHTLLLPNPPPFPSPLVFPKNRNPKVQYARQAWLRTLKITAQQEKNSHCPGKILHEFD